MAERVVKGVAQVGDKVIAGTKTKLQFTEDGLWPTGEVEYVYGTVVSVNESDNTMVVEYQNG